VQSKRRDDFEAAGTDAMGTKDFYLEDPEGYIIAFGESDHSN
jgi:hypothetical protein